MSIAYYWRAERERERERERGGGRKRREEVCVCVCVWRERLVFMFGMARIEKNEKY